MGAGHLRWRRTNVGAGLPAMASLRCVCQTTASASQASQLPHRAGAGQVSQNGRYLIAKRRPEAAV
ncbi:hypothetical protein FW764_13205 [Pseudomonas sp. 1152_12]